MINGLVGHPSGRAAEIIDVAKVDSLPTYTLVIPIRREQTTCSRPPAPEQHLESKSNLQIEHETGGKLKGGVNLFQSIKTFFF